MRTALILCLLTACGSDGDAPAGDQPQGSTDQHTPPNPPGQDQPPQGEGTPYVDRSNPDPGAQEGPPRQPGQANAGEPSFDGASGEATDAQIESAVLQHINAEKQVTGGTFIIHDFETNQEVRLDFVDLNETFHNVEGQGYFAYGNFRAVEGEAGQLYEVGFWIRVQGGRPMVTRHRITKEPVKDGDNWEQESIYSSDAEWPHRTDE